MLIDFATINAEQRYKLMASLIVPRPIALVTTIGPTGVVNAAPFSFFNMFSEEPPVVILGIGRQLDGALKDTAANIERSREFVVHIPDEHMAEQMHRCSERYSPSVSELDAVGLTACPSSVVAPPRIAQAPVAFECTLADSIDAKSRQLYIGLVHCLHVREGLVDLDTWRVRLRDYHPVARFGANYYVTTRERFTLAEVDPGRLGGTQLARRDEL